MDKEIGTIGPGDWLLGNPGTNNYYDSVDYHNNCGKKECKKQSMIKALTPKNLTKIDSRLLKLASIYNVCLDAYRNNKSLVLKKEELTLLYEGTLQIENKEAYQMAEDTKLVRPIHKDLAELYSLEEDQIMIDCEYPADDVKLFYQSGDNYDGLYIEGCNTTTYPESIEIIVGDLTVYGGYSGMKSVEGYLPNLKRVTRDVNAHSLLGSKGLENLEYVGGVLRADRLANVEGLASLTHVGSIDSQFNEQKIMEKIKNNQKKNFK